MPALAPKLPIVEQITQSVEAALNKITTVNGYQQTLSIVTRGRVPAKGTKDNGAILTEMDPEAIDGGDTTINVCRWWQPYTVLLLCFEPEKSDMPPRQRLQILGADVHIALMADNQRGGLAHDTRIRAANWFEGASEFFAADALLFYFAVDFSHDIDNPYLLRT